MRSLVLFIFLIVLTFCSCSRKYYIDKENLFVYDSFSVDSCDLYVRKVFKNLSTDSNFYSQYQIDSNSLLVEIQYLFIPTGSKQVIYITTVPDKNERFYNDKSIDTLINAYNFQDFYLGTKDAGLGILSFELKKMEKMEWLYKHESDDLIIQNLLVFKKDKLKNNYSINHALFEEPKFTEVKNHKFVFYDSAFKSRRTLSKPQTLILEPKLLLDFKYIYFKIVNNEDYNFIKFKKSRLKTDL